MRQVLAFLMFVFALGAYAQTPLQYKYVEFENSGTWNATFDSATTEGSTIVVFGNIENAVSDRLTSVSDNKGSSSTIVIESVTGPDNYFQPFAAILTGGTRGATHTVTTTLSNFRVGSMLIVEFPSGFITNSTTYGSASVAEAGPYTTAPFSGAPVNPSGNGVHLSLFGLYSAGGSFADVTPGSGWTEVGEVASGDSTYRASLIYREAASGVSQTPAGSGGSGNRYVFATHIVLNASLGGSPPTLSSPTPSGTLGTETTATVGATSTASTGTFYAILSTSNNASGASCPQIKAGQNSTGASASFAEDDTVSTTSPSVGFTGLTAGTLYYYAACHADTNGDSNVVSGSFTTAAADIVATKLIFGSQPGNIVVGQTFGAFTVRAVDDSNDLDEDFEDDVTVALETGNGELAGTLTETAVAGIATFDDVHIDTLNVDAVIQATADGLTAANSDEFDVTAGGEGGTAGFPSSSRLGGVLQ